MTNKALDRRFFQGRQDWSYESLWEYAGEKLHIRLKRDSYDEQSSARCSVYEPQARQWHHLTEVPYSQMKCLPVSYGMRTLSEAQKELFYMDEAELLRLAGLVLPAPVTKRKKA